MIKKTDFNVHIHQTITLRHNRRFVFPLIYLCHINNTVTVLIKPAIQYVHKDAVTPWAWCGVIEAQTAFNKTTR